METLKNVNRLVVCTVLLSILPCTVTDGTPPVAGTVTPWSGRDLEGSQPPGQTAVINVDATEAYNDKPDDTLTVTFQTEKINLEVESGVYVVAILSRPVEYPCTLIFLYNDGSELVSYQQRVTIVQSLPPLIFAVNQTTNNFQIVGSRPGSVTVGANLTTPSFSRRAEAQVDVVVVQSQAVQLLVDVLGWLYFVCWSVSFYPQAFTHWTRKSVVGFSFDYLVYSMTGFVSYLILEGSLFWNNSIQKSYMALHPGGIIPVSIADVVYPIHCICLLLIMLVQCIIYERGKQRVSLLCGILTSAFVIFALITVVLAGFKVIEWLTCVYWISYIKLFTTTLKYLPQIWLHYSMKTTEGWSIFGVLLDFSGGMFSIIQMFLIAYNHGDWSSLNGNLTKLGLGLISCMANVVLFCQHFFVYRPRKGYTVIDETDVLRC